MARPLVIRGLLGVGALIRDSEGKWVVGCHRFIGFTTNIIAELWALRDGLHLAHQLHIDYLVLEVDALSVISLLHNADCRNLSLRYLVTDCRILLATFQHSRLYFTSFDRCVGALAKMGNNPSSLWNFNFRTEANHLVMHLDFPFFYVQICQC
ncbi:uncharacterized protein LOC128039993 [Gossypium raimondii]|uniref:uncharacterized protein LOC128039993 n=1 Tax=Gossypium raimondii TaxID=29730 RepID=UPI00227B1202|nr:uncharacterized protein LOC128039993 [Gossypium raimondii]